ncbi:MAG: hypothetical protein FWF18_05050 [Dehalococcoidia bacterium]|nr:hypothetical protein [Dehalococcoidia bacterium]
MAELGKIEKPEAAQFKNGRKLFFVPLVFHPVEENNELKTLVEKYWSEAASQLANLEASLSKATKVYHEMIPSGGDLKRLEHTGLGSAKMAATLVDKGAALTPIEDDALMDEFADWGRCLSIHLRSPAVYTKLYASYLEAGGKRAEHIAKRLDETLGADETGVLFMQEGHRVQFPTDIQVFYVAPPGLDAAKRAWRDHNEAVMKKYQAADEEKAEPPAQDENTGE